MQGDTPNAIAFLRLFYPKGPWVLTAIDPNKKGLETATFLDDDEDKLVAWIDKWNGKRNLYFSVAEPMRPVTKKMGRTDIKRVWYLHVDVDPRAGEDLAEEQERCKNLVTTDLPEGVPPPTFALFSGGGYQAFWRLKDPIVIEGDMEKAEAAKLFNVQLERLFGADNVHNIDRIMRLPGTVNIPDEKKRAKGRTEQVAKLLETEQTVYDNETFTAAQPVQLPKTSIGGAGPTQVKVEISGNIARLDSVEDLDAWNVPDRVRVIIVQGSDPDQPKPGDNSRSGWLFDCCCNLVRAGVPDDVIYSIITDPDFLISESVLDKGSNSERYATRTIARAKEEAIEPALRELNEQHAVILNWGGKCVVIEELADPIFNGRTRLTKQTFGAFRDRYMNRRVQTGTDNNGAPTYMPMSKWWLEHAARRQFRAICFAPGKDTPLDYNLWQGFAYVQKPGDCSLFLEHMLTNVCSGNKEHFDYLVGWMARTVQKPASAGQVAVVLRGGQGTGKGIFAKTFGALFGRHFMQVSNASHLVGNFNAHLRDSCVLFADEAFFAGDKKHESVLKTLITEDSLAIEAKGVDVEMQPNYTHIIMASNDDWVVPANADERRYFVLDVGAGQKQNAVYFEALLAQMNNGGYEALLDFLVKYDLSDYQVRTVPQTKALSEQKTLSLDPIESWWHGRLTDGALLLGQSSYNGTVSTDDLYQDYVMNAKDAGINRRGGSTQLGIFLRNICGEGWPRRKKILTNVTVPTEDGYQIETKKQIRHYIFPSLAMLRSTWDEKYGATDWPPEDDQSDDDQVDIPF